METHLYDFFTNLTIQFKSTWKFLEIIKFDKEKFAVKLELLPNICIEPK